MDMAPGYYQMKIEAKETLSCLIPCLLVFTQQLEILVTTLVILIKSIWFVIIGPFIRGKIRRELYHL